MSKIYRCKSCGRTIQRHEELRTHLHWHKITDANVEPYFTEEEGGAAEPAAQPQPEKEKSKGLMGWLRRK